MIDCPGERYFHLAVMVEFSEIQRLVAAARVVLQSEKIFSKSAYSGSEPLLGEILQQVF